MGILENLTGGKKFSMISQGVESIIGEGARFKGEFATHGSVNINGEFDGKVTAEGEVIVSPGGRVVGEIHGGTVTISGRVDGNITAKDILEVARSGKVHGDLTGGKVVIEDGATYHGRVKVESKNELKLPDEGIAQEPPQSFSQPSQP